ncbi:MAG: phosphotransferase [Candidatus Heimdallarchaeota archaeon]
MSEHQSDTTKRIIQKIHLEETLSQIAEHFQEYFFDQFEAQTGQRPRFFAINDVSRVKKFGRSGMINLISVQYSTEMGKQTSKIAIKFFKTSEKTLEEARKANILRERLQNRQPPVPDIKTPKLLHSDPKLGLLVYEGIDGTEYNDTKLPPSKKASLAGRALAAIHGPDIREINIARYEGLVTMATVQLPGAGIKLKDIFLDLFGKQMKLLTTSLGGTTPFGDFHDGNILFSSTSSDLGGKQEYLGSENPIIWIIDPEYLEDTSSSVSRFEDIGIFFSIFFFQEYERTNSISKTQNLLKHFLRDYDTTLQMWGAPSLHSLYPDGFPINFDVSVALLIEGLDILERYGKNKRTKEMYKKRVKFAIKLLSEDLIQI